MLARRGPTRGPDTRTYEQAAGRRPSLLVPTQPFVVVGERTVSTTQKQALEEQRNRAVPAASDILTRDEVAAWLKVKPRQVERLRVPCLDLGVKTKRYLRSDVEAWLQAKRAGRVTRDIGAVPPLA